MPGLGGLAKPGLSRLAMPLLRVVLHIFKFVDEKLYTQQSSCRCLLLRARQPVEALLAGSCATMEKQSVVASARWSAAASECPLATGKALDSAAASATSATSWPLASKLLCRACLQLPPLACQLPCKSCGSCSQMPPPAAWLCQLPCACLTRM